MGRGSWSDAAIRRLLGWRPIGAAPQGRQGSREALLCSLGEQLMTLAIEMSINRVIERAWIWRFANHGAQIDVLDAVPRSDLSDCFAEGGRINAWDRGVILQECGLRALWHEDQHERHATCTQALGHSTEQCVEVGKALLPRGPERRAQEVCLVTVAQIQ